MLIRRAIPTGEALKTEGQERQTSHSFLTRQLQERFKAATRIMLEAESQNRDGISLLRFQHQVSTFGNWSPNFPK